MSDREKREEQTRIARYYQQLTEKQRGQRDGVVVTPVEIVDFQIHAVIDTLAEQGRTLADPQVRITDPFGGTGIYLARMMQLATLTPDELDDLYHHRMRQIELDADACRIADKNLRTVYQQETGREARHSIVHNRDTFAMTQEDFDRLWDTEESA
ncbi:hypothetical protein [Corynebacterium lujinxingii]|uniref:DNA methylase adenine-specific domain-containing protein n=1 Tax=Corynebacterium lujinxingii TaxID=2763010 RepID=A0A7H0K0Q2_9CORY|nr:hypothetical protein [Corynebacterium lujinxingii]MBC3179387.1 hypothetical protein [Corynebacterium lujinxingii]NNO11495.1 hypothetical protein [Corynebacterium lujinxingii]QNP90868.1 hypothetical protein IAU68_03635 [Corynebacterium lujinxingii]